MPEAIVKEISGSTVRLTCTSAPGCEDCESLACTSRGDKSEIKAELPANLDLSPGDTVEIEPEDEILWGVGALFFLLPMLCFLAGVLAGYYLTRQFQLFPLPPELTGFIGGLALLLLSLPVVRWLGKQFATSHFLVKIKN